MSPCGALIIMRRNTLKNRNAGDNEVHRWRQKFLNNQKDGKIVAGQPLEKMPLVPQIL